MTELVIKQRITDVFWDGGIDYVQRYTCVMRMVWADTHCLQRYSRDTYRGMRGEWCLYENKTSNKNRTNLPTEDEEGLNPTEDASLTSILCVMLALSKDSLFKSCRWAKGNSNQHFYIKVLTHNSSKPKLDIKFHKNKTRCAMMIEPNIST